MVIPFFYVVLMVSSIVTPTFIILVGILALFGWIPDQSLRTRGSVLRERNP